MPKHIYNDPKYYSENNALQYNFAMRMLRHLSFQKDSRVLDIGCGDGLITSEVARIVSDGCVIGTDISQKMVEHAATQYCSIPNIRFIQMDASQNIFREQFDIITSFNCLHWVSDQHSALLGIAKAAVEGAQIALLLSHKKSLYHEVLDALCSSDEWSLYFKDQKSARQFFSADFYRELLVESGLDIISLNEEEMIYHFESKESVAAFFAAAGSQPTLLPSSKRSRFISDFSDAYTKNVKTRQDGAIPIAFWCLQIVARKPSLLPSVRPERETQAFFAKL